MESTVQERQAAQAGRVTLDSRLEELNLSRMTQNTLKRAGCTTVRSIVEIALKRPLRRFGEGGREEVELALRHKGIMPPPPDSDRHAALAEAAHRLEGLQRQIEADMRRWQQQIDSLAELIRDLAGQP